MKKYKRIHEALWGLLVATGAVNSEELVSLGFTEESAQRYANWIIELIEFEAEQTGKDVVDITFSINSKQIIGKLTNDPRDTILL